MPDQAASGMDAIEVIRNNTYEIVFLDHMMPKMDGIETLAMIKEDNLTREGMTIIALTANAVVGAKETYLNAGFDDYLSKPIEVDKLEEKLEKYLPEDIVTWKTKEKPETKPEETVGNKNHQSEEDILEFAPSEGERSNQPSLW